MESDFRGKLSWAEAGGIRGFYRCLAVRVNVWPGGPSAGQ